MRDWFNVRAGPDINRTSPVKFYLPNDACVGVRQQKLRLRPRLIVDCFVPKCIADDIGASLNGKKMTKRQIGKIAKLAELIRQGYPCNGNEVCGTR